MRIGSNPHKDQPKGDSGYLHQVVIPVYIPSSEGYFSDSFEILKLCLKSLFGTVHDKTYITIVDNGCHATVGEYLDGLYAAGQIQEVVHCNNIGKINAAMKGLSGHDIELVTIADADAMFLPGWQSATNDVFEAFPKAGVVGIVPMYKMFNRFCENIIVPKFFSRKLKFVPFADKDGLARFYQSIGWDAPLHPLYARLTLGIDSDSGLTALLGTGHFISTFKRDIFEKTPIHFDFKLGGDSEEIIDGLCLEKDYWRLTTHRNYGYHLGNTLEDWMPEVAFEKENSARFKGGFPTFRRIGRFSYFIRNVFFRKLFFNPRIKRLLYLYKKLPSDMLGKY